MIFVCRPIALLPKISFLIENAPHGCYYKLYNNRGEWFVLLNVSYSGGGGGGGWWLGEGPVTYNK